MWIPDLIQARLDFFPFIALRVQRSDQFFCYRNPISKLAHSLQRQVCWVKPLPVIT